MAAVTEPVSALTLIMSSAVVSATVNVGWNAFARYLDRRKEAKKIDHVYLALALHLENFARRCNERLYDISEAMDQYRSFRDSSAFGRFAPFLLNFDPEPDWTSLPIPFVAKIKALPTRFEQCNSWINTQFELWADLDDAYELDEERLAFYGLKACIEADEIRVKIKAGVGEMSDLITHFETVLEQRRTQYFANPDVYTVIPELRAQFENTAASS